jgi:hypothetical protein
MPGEGQPSPGTHSPNPQAAASAVTVGQASCSL